MIRTAATRKFSKPSSRHGSTRAPRPGAMVSPAFHMTLAGPAATENFAAKLAKLARAGDCITLSGELGAGKSVFARAFIRALAGPVDVPSPTFTLVQTYDAPIPVWHADL